MWKYSYTTYARKRDDDMGKRVVLCVVFACAYFLLISFPMPVVVEKLYGKVLEDTWVLISGVTSVAVGLVVWVVAHVDEQRKRRKKDAGEAITSNTSKEGDSKEPSDSNPYSAPRYAWRNPALGSSVSVGVMAYPAVDCGIPRIGFQHRHCRCPSQAC